MVDDGTTLVNKMLMFQARRSIQYLHIMSAPEALFMTFLEAYYPVNHKDFPVALEVGKRELASLTTLPIWQVYDLLKKLEEKHYIHIQKKEDQDTIIIRFDKIAQDMNNLADNQRRLYIKS